MLVLSTQAGTKWVPICIANSEVVAGVVGFSRCTGVGICSRRCALGTATSFEVFVNLMASLYSSEVYVTYGYVSK